MAKVIIYPANILILSALVARLGHPPPGSAISFRELLHTPVIDSPTFQLTSGDAK